MKGLADSRKVIKIKGAANQLDSPVKTRTRAKRSLATQQIESQEVTVIKKPRVQKAGSVQKVTEARTSLAKSPLDNRGAEMSAQTGSNNNATMLLSQSVGSGETPVVGSAKA